MGVMDEKQYIETVFVCVFTTIWMCVYVAVGVWACIHYVMHINVCVSLSV